MNEFYDFLVNAFKHRAFNDIVTGIYASLAFLFIISRLKPRIKICDNISFEYKRDGGQQRLNYYFKIINRSYFFKIYDINVRVSSSLRIPSTNSENIIHEAVKLKKDRVWFVNNMNYRHLFQDIFHNEKRLNSRTDYAVQFLTNENLREMIREGKCIKFELIAKHSLTGFTRVIFKEFKHETEIIKGSFLSGNTCLIKKR